MESGTRGNGNKRGRRVQGESLRETIGLDREGAQFDKWAVYLAFTVNEVRRDDVLPSSLPPLSASTSLRCYEVRLIGPRARSGDAAARSSPKGGTSR